MVAMQSGVVVDRARWLAAPPEQVFAALTDIGRLARILPRVSRLRVLEQGADHARLAALVGMGPLGSSEVEGQVRWQEGHEVVFRTARPAAVVSRWLLVPADGGTLLRTSLAVDLGPMLGPLAIFVPAASLERVLGRELEATLAAVAGALAS